MADPKRPDWVKPGTAVVLLSNIGWSGASMIVEDKIERLTQRDIVLASGRRYRFDRAVVPSLDADPMLVAFDPPRTSYGYSRADNARLMHPDNPLVAQARDRKRILEREQSTYIDLKVAYSRLCNTSSPTQKMADEMHEAAAEYVAAREWRSES
jgi:hypothetical protein